MIPTPSRRRCATPSCLAATMISEARADLGHHEHRDDAVHHDAGRRANAEGRWTRRSSLDENPTPSPQFRRDCADHGDVCDCGVVRSGGGVCVFDESRDPPRAKREFRGTTPLAGRLRRATCVWILAQQPEVNPYDSLNQKWAGGSGQPGRIQQRVVVRLARQLSGRRRDGFAQNH